MAEVSHSLTVNPQQAAFISAYLENGRNATDAYILAYGLNGASRKDVSGRASRLLNSKRVQQALGSALSAPERAVADAVVKYEITAERVAEELACLAFTRLQQVATVVQETDQHGKQRLAVHVKPFAECDSDALAAIVEVKRTAGGEVSVKLADKRAALMDIARLKGWIADKPVDNKQLVMLKIER